MKQYTLPGTKFNHLVSTIIKTDLKVGLTFSTIALQSSRDECKRSRNCRNARIAHDSVLRQIERIALSDADEAEIQPLLADLKLALKILGESF